MRRDLVFGLAATEATTRPTPTRDGEPRQIGKRGFRRAGAIEQLPEGDRPDILACG